MYETADNTPSARILPQRASARFRETAEAIDARSSIVWSEHCTECAYPSCYSSCAFYSPRRDKNCRRFATGITQWRDGMTTLGQVRFKKWAKLEGTGPVALMPSGRARWGESVDRVASAAIARLWPDLVYNELARNWNKLKRGIGSRAGAHVPSGFMLEAFSPTPPPYALLLTILPIGPDENESFQCRIPLGGGYNRTFVPFADIRARVDLDRPFLIQIEPVGEYEGQELVFGLIDFVRLAPASAIKHRILGESDAAASGERSSHKAQKLVKCVVWDLDDTLWRGTLAEDGAAALTVDPLVLSTIVELDRRGILQSAASKNDPEPALAALVALGIRDYLLFPQIGWGPKSQAVARIAELLDIGLDTFIFVDDQPFERGEVGETLPDVTVMSALEIASLLTHPRLDVPATAESGKRRAMYQTEERRLATFEHSGTDYLSFLRGCFIRLEIDLLSPASLERAYELSQRTNQLNVSGTRYSRDDIASLMSGEGGTEAFMLGCSDRFGDYGIIGMCVLDRRQARVHAFMMSCRVQRKRVEQAFFSWLVARVKSRGQHDVVEV
ncbi:MAG: HAD-IIIC family phosphatase, partial [Xanthobacteraceae bacterium]|nr:HAD-IIIC family phosphatase [Xanthobacteraceae bacterium]